MREPKQETMVLVSKGREAVVGTCVHTPGKGWKFLSRVTSHGDSRKFWPDCVECIPAWAMELADEMLGARDWEKHQANKATA